MGALNSHCESRLRLTTHDLALAPQAVAGISAFLMSGQYLYRRFRARRITKPETCQDATKRSKEMLLSTSRDSSHVLDYSE